MDRFTLLHLTKRKRFIQHLLQLRSVNASKQYQENMKSLFSRASKPKIKRNQQSKKLCL